MVISLRPKKGGFARVFGCGWFIREFLMGHSPYGSCSINVEAGASQSVMFREYKLALIRETCMERAIRQEERLSKQERRSINLDNIDKFNKQYLEQTKYKSTGCRYHSFLTYFGNLIRLEWVELTGEVEHSEFQEHYPDGHPRSYYRITAIGIDATEDQWRNPQAALYGR
jgi:hypothetical protein